MIFLYIFISFLQLMTSRKICVSINKVGCQNFGSNDIFIEKSEEITQTLKTHNDDNNEIFLLDKQILLANPLLI